LLVTVNSYDASTPTTEKLNILDLLLMNDIDLGRLFTRSGLVPRREGEPISELNAPLLGIQVGCLMPPGIHFGNPMCTMHSFLNRFGSKNVSAFFSFHGPLLK
jgi:hypothetical protein